MINASNFAYRIELDRHVQTLAVENLAIEERIISGTIEELKKLSLSHGRNACTEKCNKQCIPTPKQVAR